PATPPKTPSAIAAHPRTHVQVRTRRRSALLPDSRDSFSSRACTTKSITDTSDITQCSLSSRWRLFGMRVASWTHTSDSVAINHPSPSLELLTRYLNNSRGGRNRMGQYFREISAEHWKHLRTSNVIESLFATVRLRQRVTKDAGSRTKGLLMAYKL